MNMREMGKKCSTKITKNVASLAAFREYNPEIEPIRKSETSRKSGSIKGVSQKLLVNSEASTSRTNSKNRATSKSTSKGRVKKHLRLLSGQDKLDSR